MKLKLAAYIASDAQASGDWRKKYDEVGNFYGGFAIVRFNDKWGLVNTEGVEVVPLKYDNLVHSFSGLFNVKLNGKGWGLVNTAGKEVVEPKYDYIHEDSRKDLARVRVNGKSGFINQKGEEVVKVKYDGASMFGEYLALVDLDGKFGFVNTEGKEVVPLGKYDDVDNHNYIDDFDQSFARVRLNGKWGWLDDFGKEVVPPEYTEESLEAIPTVVRLLALKRNISEKEALKLVFEEMAK